MIPKKPRTILSLITKLIDGSKEYVTNDFDIILNLNGTGIGANDLSAILAYLRSENLIRYTDSDSVIEDISLTEYGRLYPQIYRQWIIESFLKSIVCPIVVTIITTLCTLLFKGIL